jgi:hypothetical protein
MLIDVKTTGDCSGGKTSELEGPGTKLSGWFCLWVDNI